MTNRWAVVSSSAETAGRATTRGHVNHSNPCPQVRLHRVLWWGRKHLSEGGGIKLPCSSSRSRLNAALSVQFLWREMAAACTCSVLCAELSGAGSAASPGTGSVWEHTGSGEKAQTHVLLLTVADQGIERLILETVELLL